MGTTPWSGKEYVKEGGDYAASYVSHDDAVEFYKKLTSQERATGKLPKGWKYSLPTEAQWEYACRASTTTRFSFGENELQLGDYGWFKGNADDKKEEYAHQVGLKKPNAWGLKDMHGNVWEWCSDWKAATLVGGRDPQGPLSGSFRVNRGGGWGDDAVVCRSADRRYDSPGNRYGSLGFRLAAVPD